MLLASEKNYDAAFRLTSSDMREVYPLQMLRSQFETLQAYTEISFNKVQISNGRTTLVGTATTKDNCISTIAFVIANKQVSTFQIENPCLVEQVAA